MHTKTNKTTATAAFSYEDNGIGQTLREQLEASAAHIFDLGRRTTEQTFELGDHLAQAADLLADGRFDKWVKTRCGLSARSARNNMAVFRNLGQFRDELVDLSVGATVLFHLSSATEDQVKAAIAFAEDNGRLQVADVKAILAGGVEGGDKPETGDQFRVGGVAGLKALIAIKIRDGLKAFITHIVAICQAIEAALAKSRVIKEALAKDIQDIARVARQELESLALFIEPDLDWGRNTKPTKFPKKTGWAEVNDTLYTLGGVDAWPKSKEMRDWLALHVLPVLGWAVSKERAPEWPLAAPGAPASKPMVLEEADSDGDRQDAEPAMPDEVSKDAEVSDEAIGRLGAALEEATGGLMTVSREAPRSRKQFAKVPPLADDAVVEVEAAPALVR
ncbi:hypothetical protein GGE16_005367 [Rhizobium leguminosarum]|uniref:DUF3102 domain-containing protein n=1 Tax=Rhizobium leguminosarum TaxID=384 RepID=A0AAE2MQ33_RHILE|nr:MULTISPECIES: hypothetical protein [Rhizobium]MBB4293280.1 hypothetical protein [Rhizobium leguminosarum]MBB4296111.1 hypothetical protein [Rhizobium leguminosarum]MBB4311458.1 hypothetical protein [Rhizobium leguminosarum]MBB4420340.1 hypothetical protein [Rhizobium leguminosarum]MBB4435505.1 hypothetical protein [Rhizobium esperanzae]